MCDTPQDFDDIRRTLFRFLDNNKALSRQHETAIVSKSVLLEPQPQPERTEPGEQKTAQRQEDLRQQVLPERLAQQDEDERQNDCECCPAVRRKSRVQNLETTIFRAVNDRRPSKMILPNLAERFLGMLDTAVKPEHQSGHTRLD